MGACASTPANATAVVVDKHSNNFDSLTHSFKDALQEAPSKSNNNHTKNQPPATNTAASPISRAVGLTSQKYALRVDPGSSPSKPASSASHMTTPRHIISASPISRADSPATQQRPAHQTETDMLKCSNCEAALATIFCAECNLIFCSSCDSAIHRPKRFRFHVRSPIPGAQEFLGFCRRFMTNGTVSGEGGLQSQLTTFDFSGAGDELIDCSLGSVNLTSNSRQTSAKISTRRRRASSAAQQLVQDSLWKQYFSVNEARIRHLTASVSQMQDVLEKRQAQPLSVHEIANFTETRLRESFNRPDLVAVLEQLWESFDTNHSGTMEFRECSQLVAEYLRQTVMHLQPVVTADMHATLVRAVEACFSGGRNKPPQSELDSVCKRCLDKLLPKVMPEVRKFFDDIREEPKQLKYNTRVIMKLMDSNKDSIITRREFLDGFARAIDQVFSKDKDSLTQAQFNSKDFQQFFRQNVEGLFGDSDGTAGSPWESVCTEIWSKIQQQPSNATATSDAHLSALRALQSRPADMAVIEREWATNKDVQALLGEAWQRHATSPEANLPVATCKALFSDFVGSCGSLVTELFITFYRAHFAEQIQHIDQPHLDDSDLESAAEAVLETGEIYIEQCFAQMASDATCGDKLLRSLDKNGDGGPVTKSAFKSEFLVAVRKVIDFERIFDKITTMSVEEELFGINHAAR